jgi:dolichol-phosphate mannosyltransferase
MSQRNLPGLTDLLDPRYSEIRLGIVCPMANEEASVVSFVNEVLEQCALHQFKSVTFFAVLDSQSKDNTLQLLKDLKEPSLQIIWAPENTCVADAYVRGYREALAAGCDWILEIDCGFSHQPSDIPRFFREMLQGHDCVFGSRFCAGGQVSSEPLRRRIVSRGGTILSNLLLGTSLKDMTSGFELFTRPALEHVLDTGIQSRGPFFQTEIRAYCHRLKIIELPIHYRGGSHKINGPVLQDAFSNLWRLFRLRLRGNL